MKYSYNWLKKISKTEKNSADLTEMIMLKGFELEGIENLGKKFERFVVGEILEIRKHPNADKLQLVKVDVGDEKLDVVCGAFNIKIGDKVPVALIGAILPLEKIKIEKTKIRGVESSGMLCAEDELGLGKNHSGIMILDTDFRTGNPLSKALEIDDQIIELSILPNRAHDCLSHIGMAREICAMEGRKLEIEEDISVAKKMLDQKLETGTLDIKIQDEKNCLRYMGAVISDVKIGKSPRWLVNRLIACGMEPINNVVDITNYVMLELGNPLHAFDFEKIKSKEGKISIVVRKARKGDVLELLSEETLELDENDLVIADEEKPLALAGIKGGKYSGINPDTNRIVLESANFNFFSIRKSRQRHNLLTEAQARFEKGVSPVLAEKGLLRAVELLKKYAGGKLEEVVDENFHSHKKEKVMLKMNEVEKLLGKEIDKEKALNILENLGFEKVKNVKEDEKIEFEIPFWRIDIEGRADLVEEIGRIYGYEKIKEKPILSEIGVPYKNKKRDFEWKIKNAMNALGFDEVVSYSFYGKKELENFHISGDHFEIENPLIKGYSYMRKTLAPSLVEKIALGQKHFQEVAIFEIGRVYQKNKNLKMPKEKLKISGAILKKNNKKEIFHQAKGAVEEMFDFLNLEKEKFVFQKKENEKIFAIGKSAEILFEGNVLGKIGQISVEVCQSYDIKEKVVFFEIDFEKLFSIYQEKEKTKVFRPISKFPSLFRDISMFADFEKEATFFEKIIKEIAGKALLKSELFDVYWDGKSKEKSLAFHLEFGLEERTLKGSEADKIMEKIIKELAESGAKARIC